MSVRKMMYAMGLAALALAVQAQTETHIERTSKLGGKYYSLADEKGAIAAAQKKLDADPKNVDLMLKLAQAQASVWQEREAVETCTDALALAPGNADLYLERGHRELPLRDFQHALEDLEQAAKLAPKKPDVFYHLGLAHYFRGEFAQAAEAFQHAVDLAADGDNLINSTNWLYASMRRAKKPDEAATALARMTPELTNQEPHTQFYLYLVRFFQGRMTEKEIVPPSPASDSADTETELRFDTIAYGVGNWHLYNGDAAAAEKYFWRITQGRVWVTWGFVGAETELLRK